MANDPNNCHYVSRFLTRPWEHSQRVLTFFDCATGRLDTASSRSLFAEEGSNPPEVERALNRYLETPLSRFRARYLPAPRILLDEWPVYRALHLYVLIQTARLTEVENPGEASKLSTLLCSGEGALDALTRDRATRVELRLEPVSRDALTFPEQGFFAYPLPDAECGSLFAFAVPLRPDLAMTITPKGFAPGDGWSRCHLVDTLSLFSRGFHERSRRVLIPPAWLSQKEAEIIRYLVGARKAAASGVESFAEIRQLTEKMWKVAGLTPPPVKRI